MAELRCSKVLKYIDYLVVSSCVVAVPFLSCFDSFCLRVFACSLYGVVVFLMYALLRSIMPQSRMECQVLRSTINAYILQ